jgi:hypothetical protein
MLDQRVLQRKKHFELPILFIIIISGSQQSAVFDA